MLVLAKSLPARYLDAVMLVLAKSLPARYSDAVMLVCRRFSSVNMALPAHYYDNAVQHYFDTVMSCLPCKHGATGTLLR
jgi:hypothetical protein